MTRDTYTVKPQNNIYTVLLIAATVVTILGLIVVLFRSQALFGTMF